MSKFKVGDKVRGNENSYLHRVGTVGVIDEIVDNGAWVIWGKGDRQFALDSEIDPIEEQPDPEPDYAALAKEHGICITVKIGDTSITYDGR